ncbi:MAG: SRPBCC domain-containing protein [Proteobacteria bacterium]|nr:SRPBCC domain-containing protein [Pseudomonadota bacterium]
MNSYAKALMIPALALGIGACSHIPLIGHADKAPAAAAEPPAAAPSVQAKAESTPTPAPAPAPSAMVTGSAAATVSSAQGHIELKYAFNTRAAPDRVYAAITGVARWWDASHTYSGNASNLSLDARAGGCWCEQLADGGSVQHMTVLAAMPGRMLRLSGGLGPLQSGAVNATMTWTIKHAGEGSEVDMSYLVDGYYPGGLAAVRDDVDAVLAHQVERLRAYIDAR